MPPAPTNHGTHDYAERIRKRLPRRFQALREAMDLSNVYSQLVSAASPSHFHPLKTFFGNWPFSWRVPCDDRCGERQT